MDISDISMYLLAIALRCSAACWIENCVSCPTE